uniref:Lipid-binding serum glycoprotein N-terminal domain-containing protein n=1 Tax=Clastoptera arizonana TaxID=38151 RepID=A0A1B6D5Y5_9HEMI
MQTEQQWMLYYTLFLGIPEMQVPSIEPLVIPQLIAAQGNGLKVITENLKVFGCGNFTIVNLNVNLPRNVFNFNIILPHLVLDGRYIIDGKILLIPIKGKGNMKGHIYNAKANVSLSGEIVKREGEDYLHYTKMTIKIKVGSGKLHLDNLFGGSPALGQVINTAINANFNSFINELRPIIEQALAKFMLESADKIVSSFTYKELFPLK